MLPHRHIIAVLLVTKKKYRIYSIGKENAAQNAFLDDIASGAPCVKTWTPVQLFLMRSLSVSISARPVFTLPFTFPLLLPLPLPHDLRDTRARLFHASRIVSYPGSTSLAAPSSPPKYSRAGPCPLS